ncbi:signal peptidase I [Chitiniphilus shinanonensis]|uniref:Signal peptidase I n=1 Tax=Chitiniphilus shinanonensis TaxID=553088 RepID=A0ABQ6BP75_9NEIS|nr:signal peptidase I [Chitiniphilus shinanonensis]GLS03259.1 signal peptidase I [Chitiniphilus shinanonensis]
MNWQLIGVVVTVVGVIMSIIGAKHERKGDEPPQLVQYGYLAVIVGVFILLVNFFSIAAAMLIFVLITGVIWVADKFVLAKKRQGERPSDWVEYGRGFFPVILVVFLLRSFLVEPYQIPSSSMRPGLVVGDFILVNKYAYGIRLPVLNKVVIPVGTPQHGDVMVFNYPKNPSINYIKRVIGLPGDTVEYRDKKLTVNGQTVTADVAGPDEYAEGIYMNPVLRVHEKFENKQYDTFVVPDQPWIKEDQVDSFPYRENCRYDDSGFVCKVPEGHYFMMGDNRDHSADSRYWGFVTDDYVVGRAFFVWFNYKQLGRIGTVIR